MIAERAYKAWEDFSKAGVKRPVTEQDYAELHNFMDDLTSNQDINAQPWSDLFGLVAGYMHEWELEHEPELKNPDIAPDQILEYLLEQRDVSQYRLAKDGVVNQGTLSSILAGKRGISKELAKKLSDYFGVSVEMFL